MLNANASHGVRRYLKSTGLRQLTVSILRAIFDAYVEFTNHVGPDSAHSLILCEYFPRQKVNSVPTDATAYSCRGNWLNVTFGPSWGNQVEFDSYAKEWTYKIYNKCIVLEKLDESVPEGEKVVGKKAYFNASMGDEKVAVVFGDNYPRLRELKRKYDPNCVFRKWFPIVPAET
jgi:hypothetical protein